MLQSVETVRVWFRKAGAAKYISHLDLTHCMGRALKLSRLPVWYTEGFNPRIYMTYAMPLSLGVAGERECMDIRLTQPVPYGEVADRLGRHLPQGLELSPLDLQKMFILLTSGPEENFAGSPRRGGGEV